MRDGFNGHGATPGNVTIRMAETDLDLARKQAEEKGLPYQTYIKSVLHEALVKRQRRWVS